MEYFRAEIREDYGGIGAVLFRDKAGRKINSRLTSLLGLERGSHGIGVGTHRRTLVLLSVGILILLAGLSGMGPTLVAAQDQGDNIQRYEQVAGPYAINAAVIQSGLSLGVTLFAITVVDEATGLAIPDVKVFLFVKHEDSEEEGKGAALNTPNHPERYDAKMDLTSSGLWRVTIDVDSSKGRVAVQMIDLIVPSTRRITGGTYVFIGVFAIIIFGAAYVWWSTQRQRSKNQGSGTTPT